MPERERTYSMTTEHLGIFGAPLSSGMVCIRSLFTAIIERALFDFSGSDVAHGVTASEWLFDEGATIHDTWTFPWVCDCIDIDFEAIRYELRYPAKRSACRPGKPRKLGNRHRVERSQPSL